MIKSKRHTVNSKMNYRTNPVKVYFEDSASENENPIVLLHGLGSDHTSWVYQLDMLKSNGFRPITVDIPGFGQSVYPYHRWTIRRVALLITRSIIDELDGQISLAGLSMGGTVAQEIVRIRPEKISKLVLISTFACLRPSFRKTLPYLSKRFRQVVNGDIRDQAVIVADRIFPSEDQSFFHDYLIDQIKHSNPKIYRQAMIALAAFNSVPWMRHWQGETLVISGDLDTTVTLENQRRLARILPSVRFEIIHNGGHAVSIDHKDQFNQILLNFLQNYQSGNI